jgi:hypothetical protein
LPVTGVGVWFAQDSNPDTTLPLTIYDAVQARRYDEANVIVLIMTLLVGGYFEFPSLLKLLRFPQVEALPEFELEAAARNKLSPISLCLVASPDRFPAMSMCR